MHKSQQISIEVVYALPDKQTNISLQAKKGSTLKEAIDQSQILRQYPQIDLTSNKVGVYGKIRSLDDIISPGDRIEIYRSLIADPKEVRKRRAKHKEKNK